MLRVRDVRDQLLNLCERVELVPESNPNSADITPIQKAITAGYFMNSARLQHGGESYRNIKQNVSVHIHPSSCLHKHVPHPRFLCYYELVETSKNFMRQVMEIRSDWLMYVLPLTSDVARHYFSRDDINDSVKEKRMQRGRGMAPSQASQYEGGRA